MVVVPDLRDATTLIDSGFHESTIPGALIFECQWEHGGVRCYSSALVTPDMVTNVRFWNDMLEQVGWWYTHRKRKHGEIACIRT